MYFANKKKSKGNEAYFKKTEKWAKITLILGVLFLIFTPFIFTRSSLFSNLDFSATGQIGDTIGGITAPFMGLVGSILVFLSFKSQTDMNRKQFEAIDKQFKKMEEDKKQKKYAHMQHVIDIVNDRYIDDYFVFFHQVGKGGLIPSLKNSSNLIKDDENSKEGRKYIINSYKKIQQLTALLHLKYLIEFDQNHKPSKNQINFIKIQVSMILTKINFVDLYPEAIGYIKHLRNLIPEDNTSLSNIEFFLYELRELENICDDNGIPDVKDFY